MIADSILMTNFLNQSGCFLPMKTTRNFLVCPSMACQQISFGNIFALGIFMTMTTSKKIYCFSYFYLSFCSTLLNDNIIQILSSMVCLVGCLSHLLSSHFRFRKIKLSLIKVCLLFRLVQTLFGLRDVVMSFFISLLLTQQKVV